LSRFAKDARFDPAQTRASIDWTVTAHDVIVGRLAKIDSQRDF
jgi:hypothetical protein